MTQCRPTRYGRFVTDKASQSRGSDPVGVTTSDGFKPPTGRKAPVRYPMPSSASTSAVMRSNRKTDTRPELRVRKELHRRGLRFRKHFVAALGARRKVTIDVAFPRLQVAVFVDGCFWHGCPIHGVAPKLNSWYWTPKLKRNSERDLDVDRLLEAAGWRVVRIWEHSETRDAADAVETGLLETRLKPIV
jgi:DNA mismatch endonuclease (patch repair protein)